MRVLALMLLLLPAVAAGQDKLWLPSELHAAAARDAQALPPPVREHARYLSLAGVADKDRPLAAKVVSFHCNALSTESDITLPVAVAGAPLLRIYYPDYGWSRGTWENLAESEPYYHVKTKTVVKTLWGGGVWRDGKSYPAGSFYTEKEKVVTAIAPWVAEGEGRAAAAYLVEACQTQAPLVDARWFVWQTAIQADRSPGYYDFLGIQDKKGFDALVGYDAKLQAASKRVELLEAVATSTVTLQPRRLGAFPAISGNYWQTFDSREAKDEHNPLRILNGGFRFDAQEVFGHAPNGMLVWGLFNNQGVRQDAAPDFIASDSTAHGTDRRVHAGLSCLRCHLPNGGINPVDGWARSLFVGDLKLQSPDYDKLKELRQKYLRDLEGPMEDSRRLYARAILQATGLKPPELATAYGLFFAAYDAPVAVERAARDAGMEVQAFQAALKTYLLKTGTVDTVAAAFLRKGGIGPVQYHETFPSLMLALRGLQQP